jgi:hypothetical protein
MTTGMEDLIEEKHLPDFICSLLQPPQAFPHFGDHTVGSGHAPLALRADWQAQMLRCHNELGFQHVRFHAMLSKSLSLAKKPWLAAVRSGIFRRIREIPCMMSRLRRLLLSGS